MVFSYVISFGWSIIERKYTLKSSKKQKKKQYCNIKVDALVLQH